MKIKVLALLCVCHSIVATETATNIKEDLLSNVSEEKVEVVELQPCEAEQKNSFCFPKTLKEKFDIYERMVAGEVKLSQCVTCLGEFQQVLADWKAIGQEKLKDIKDPLVAAKHQEFLKRIEEHEDVVARLQAAQSNTKQIREGNLYNLLSKKTLLCGMIGLGIVEIATFVITMQKVQALKS